MASDDFEFINNLFHTIFVKKEKYGCDSLTLEERVVFSIWHASGIIENGGLQYFFECELDAEAVACAYDKIGSKKCAELLRLGLSLIPDSLLQASWHERIDYIERNPDGFESLENFLFR